LAAANIIEAALICARLLANQQLNAKVKALQLLGLMAAAVLGKVHVDFAMTTENNSTLQARMVMTLQKILVY